MNTPPLASSPEQLLQASAVAIDGRAILIMGRPGSGKSTLALSLIDRGACLIGDDGVRIFQRDGTLIAAPPPNIAGKIEIRGVGIVELPTQEAPIALAISLDENGERLPAGAEKLGAFDIDIPLVALGAADTASRPLRTEWALRVHGRDLADGAVAQRRQMPLGENHE